MNLLETYKNCEFKSDKGTCHNYIYVYDRLLEPFKDKPINFLEIGLWDGNSLYLWDKYFTNKNTVIHGIDIDIKSNVTDKKFTSRVNIFKQNANTFDENEQLSEMKYDIIIEDGSHTLSDQLNFVQIFKKRINPGGMFLIEDIQSTENAISILKSDPDLFLIDTRNLTNTFGKKQYDDLLIVYFKN